MVVKTHTHNRPKASKMNNKTNKTLDELIHDYALAEYTKLMAEKKGVPVETIAKFLRTELLNEHSVVTISFVNFYWQFVEELNNLKYKIAQGAI